MQYHSQNEAEEAMPPKTNLLWCVIVISTVRKIRKKQSVKQQVTGASRIKFLAAPLTIRPVLAGIKSFVQASRSVNQKSRLVIRSNLHTRTHEHRFVSSKMHYFTFS